MECFKAVLRILDVNFLVFKVIYVHCDEFFVPDHLVRVELRDVKFLACAVVILGVVTVAGVVAVVLPVVCAIDDVFVVDGFDNVDFATGGPAYFVYVLPEHPECGPDSLAGRECNAGFNGAVGETELVLGNHARRGVLGTFIIFFLRTDMQNSVLDVGVLFAVRIIFPFVVAPAACARADFKTPFACVDCVAIEFLVPEVR